MALNGAPRPTFREKKVKVCVGHSRPVPHIAFSYPQDESYWFASSCLDGKPHLRNGETGDWVGTFEGHKGAVNMTSFNQDATRLATASSDYSAKVWDAIHGTEMHTWVHDHVVKSIDWCDNNTMILTGSKDKKVRIFDAHRPDAPPRLLPDVHYDDAKVVAALHDGASIFSACSKKVVKWDTRQASKVAELAYNDLTCMEFNKYTFTIIVSYKDTVTFIDPFEFKELETFNVKEDVACVAMSPDARLFAVGCNLKVKEFDASTGQELHQHKGHHGPVFSIRYAWDSFSYASGSEDGLVRIWPTAYVLEDKKS